MTSSQRIGAVLSRVLVAATVAFVVANLRPWLWFVDTTPTGGDLGAHVWAPAYLRDVLLGDLRLTGWTHDWYAGFPAFTFYMVIPSLLVVIVDAGVGLPANVFAHIAVISASVGAVMSVLRRLRPDRLRSGHRVLLAASAAAALVAMQVLDRLDGRTLGLGALGGIRYNDTIFDRFAAAVILPATVGWLAWTATRTRPRARLPATVAAVALTLLVIPMPYGVALKLVAVAGVVILPVAVFAMARLGGVAPAGSALAAAATVLFLFDRSYNIYGGNLMSTMAGEFAYSLGLACAVVFIGVAARGMDTGRGRVLGGALLALAGLLHLFSAFFALAATVSLLLVLPWSRREWRDRLRWTAQTGALAAALSAWWVLPFWWNRGLLNDMGWGKERRYRSALWSRSDFDYSFLVNDPPLQLFVVLAAVGAAVAVVLCFWPRLRRRLGIPREGLRLPMALAATGAMTAAAFIVLPEGRLWNVRILPFYYLAVYLTAALGAGEAFRWVGAAIDRLQAARREPGAAPGRAGAPTGSLVAGGAVLVATVAMLVLVGLPLRSLPGGRLGSDGIYRWGPFSNSASNLGPYWVQYNYEGYERRAPTDDGGGSSEYRDLVDTMTLVGESRGCGPSLWEYEAGRLGSYGTPMAPMLLPYWTDGCIGSMEGLYFEASATVPYHFLMQSELSVAPSRAQRDLPYSGLDVAAGAEHLRLMGVRYYLAFSEQAVSQARAVPGLSEVAASGPWVVFEVADSRPVVGLSELPVVVDGIGSSGDGWLEPSVGAFLAGADAPLLAGDGPNDWPRMVLPAVRGESEGDFGGGSDGDIDREEVMRRLAAALPAAAPRTAAAPVAVSEVVRRDHSISFSVDRVGAPVLVRTSYFPNWSVSGADGPYRVTPNFMVVVPTDTEVRLVYGRAGVEWLAMVITLGGLVAAGWLTLRPSRNEPPEPEASDGAGAEPPPGEAVPAAPASGQP